MQDPVGSHVNISSLDEPKSAWNLPWPELDIPPYREASLDGWSIRRLNLIPQAGYFRAAHHIRSQYTLLADETTWMSTAPMEIESNAPHVAAANDHTVVMGAGMGLTLYNILRKPDVKKVTLVEICPTAIELLQKAADIESWAGFEKLTIETTDAFEYQPSESVDHLYVDIWPALGDEQAVAQTQQIQRRVKADSVGWWGQEIAFLHWLGERPPTLKRYQAWAREIDLPLIEQGNPEYMTCIGQVAQSVFYRTVRYREEGLIEHLQVTGEKE
jgi:hypothetical protein